MNNLINLDNKSLTNLSDKSTKISIASKDNYKFRNRSKNPKQQINLDLGNNNLYVNTIYSSIQGESSFGVGRLCSFIRLSGCPLRCSWCDSTETFFHGYVMSIDKVIDTIKGIGIELVELTGGEPLLQIGSIELAKKLIESGHQVMIETSGAYPIDVVPSSVVVIMDLKCPSSKMDGHNLYENIELLKLQDEIKFVVANYDDYKWSKDVINKYKPKSQVLLSPAFGLVKPADLAQWMLDDRLKARLNLQIHKYIWHPNQKNT